MLIGVPKEIKVHEYRVGLTPDSVREFAVHGHKVVVETEAGAGIGRSDEDYRTAGAEVVGDAKAVFDRAEMIVKVKEPQASERRMMRESIVLRELSTTTLQTRPLLSTPDRRRASVRSSGLAAVGNASLMSQR